MTESDKKEEEITFARQRVAAIQNLCQNSAFKLIYRNLKKDVSAIEERVWDDPGLTWEQFQQLRGERRALLNIANMPQTLMQAEIGNLRKSGDQAAETLRSDSLFRYLSEPDPQ